MELLGLLLAGCIADAGHTGCNNAYLVSTGHLLAREFNDTAPIQNHALQLALGWMNEDKYDFLHRAALDEADKRCLRETIIRYVHPPPLESGVLMICGHCIAVLSLFNLREGRCSTYLTEPACRRRLDPPRSVVLATDMERHKDIMLRLVLNMRVATVRTVQVGALPTTAAAAAAAAASRPQPPSRPPLAETTTAFAPPPPPLPLLPPPASNQSSQQRFWSADGRAPTASLDEVTSPRQRCGRACAPGAGPLQTIDAAGLVSLQQLAMKLAHHMHLTLPVAQHVCWTERLADERRTMVRQPTERDAVSEPKHIALAPRRRKGLSHTSDDMSSLPRARSSPAASVSDVTEGCVCFHRCRRSRNARADSASRRRAWTPASRSETAKSPRKDGPFRGCKQARCADVGEPAPRVFICAQVEYMDTFISPMLRLWQQYVGGGAESLIKNLARNRRCARPRLPHTISPPSRPTQSSLPQYTRLRAGRLRTRTHNVGLFVE